MHKERRLLTLEIYVCSTADEKLVAAVCNTANQRRYSFLSNFHCPSRKSMNLIIFCLIYLSL